MHTNIVITMTAQPFSLNGGIESVNEVDEEEFLEFSNLNGRGNIDMMKSSMGTIGETMDISTGENDSSKDEEESAKDDHDDIISSTVKARMKGTPLYAVLAMTTCMAIVSFLMPLYYSLPMSSSTSSIDGNDQVQEEKERENDSSTTSTVSYCSTHHDMESNMFSAPRWADLLNIQMRLIQNLIHSALGGGAALVAALRGDVIWLLFIRNSAFYFSLVAASYLIVNVVNVIIVEKRDKEEGYGGGLTFATDFSWRDWILFIIIVLFSLTSILALWTLDSICRLVRSMLSKRFEILFTQQHDEEEDNEFLQAEKEGCSDNMNNSGRSIVTGKDSFAEMKYPPGLANTLSQQTASLGTFYCVVCLQLVSVLYTILTTIQNFSDNACDGDSVRYLSHDDNAHTQQDEMRGTEGILPFEMSYGLGAHQAFVLSLFCLASFFPTDAASVGGATLCSLWRLELSIGYMINLFVKYGIKGIWTIQRAGWSFFFTLFEALCVCPILISCAPLWFAAVGFTNDNKKRQTAPSRKEVSRKRLGGGFSYEQVGVHEMNENDSFCDVREEEVISRTVQSGEIDETRNEPLVLNDISAAHSSNEENHTPHTFTCPTLRQMSTSPQFATSKRRGACILWLSTTLLFIGMTIECIFMMKVYLMNVNMIYDIYKWGMHVAAMYLFNAIMCVASPEIYSRARPLLMITSPTGTAIAVWQLWILRMHENEAVLQGFEAQCVQFLFALRALAGLGQLIGLIVLKDIEIDNVAALAKSPQMVGGKMVLASYSIDEMDEQGLGQSIIDLSAKTKFVLLKMYVPSMYIHGFLVAVVGNCSDPMISPTTPSSRLTDCEENGAIASSFVLAQNWPGIGLFFHFGMLLVIFAFDGIQTPSPTYKPGLAISCLFSFHICLLLASSMMLRILQRFWGDSVHDDFGSLTLLDVISTLTMVAWMVSSGYLSLLLHRLWKLRVRPV